MSAVFKILNGTQRGDTDLCPSCRSMSRWTDDRGEHRVCTSHHNTIPLCGRVSSCSDYENANLPTLADMRQTAWTLRTEKGGKMIGFAAPKPTARAPWEDDDV